MVDQGREVAMLVKYSRLAYERGLVGAQGGNASIRIPDLNRVYIKPTKVSMGQLSMDSIVATDLQGRKIEGKLDAEPSKEIHLHLAIYRARDDANSVFHLHPPYTTAFAVRSVEIPLLTVSAQAKLRKVPLIKLAKPGTHELASLVADEVSKHDSSLNSVLLEKHGTITWGQTVEDAFYTAELLEETAKLAFISRNLGG